MAMNDQGQHDGRVDRLRGLLDRLQSSELQLGEAKELRLELLSLVGAREAGCTWV